MKSIASTESGAGATLGGHSGSSPQSNPGTAMPKVERLDRIVEGPRAWRGETISKADWLVPLPAECLAELQGAVELLRANPLPTLLLDPGDFALGACAALMKEVRRRLDEGCGLAVLDRLPLERYKPAETWAVFWLLGVLLARPVVQTIDGQIQIDVTDTGIKKAIGVRGFRTNAGQLAHVDNAFNHCPPDYVSLCSLTKGLEGGESRFISFYTVHNEMLRRHPELLPRLYRPFYQDRQGDFAPGESQTVFYPLFEYTGAHAGGELRSRYSHFTVPAGYKTAGEPFEGETRAAFEAITEIADDPSLYCAFTMEPGQLQFVNNHGFGHGRTAYKDPEDKSQKRRMLRLWHRDSGRRSYSG